MNVQTDEHRYLIVLAKLGTKRFLVMKLRIGTSVLVGAVRWRGKFIVLLVVGQHVELVQTLGAFHQLPLCQHPRLRALCYRSCKQISRAA